MNVRRLAPLPAFVVAVLASACTATAPISSSGAAVASAPATPVPQATAVVVATLDPSIATTPPASVLPVTTSARPSDIAIATLTPTANTEPTGVPSGSPGGLPELNPCLLLTDEQAAAVNGVTYGPGEPHQMAASAVECVWQSSSPSASVVVQVAILPNGADAAAAYAEALAAQSFAVKDVPNFADKAAIARATGGANTGGIYVREGTVLFDIVYLNGTPPSDGLLTTTAYIVLGHLPTP